MRRWTAKRKAAVLAAVESGAITAAKACKRWQLSREELADRDTRLYDSNCFRAEHPT